MGLKVRFGYKRKLVNHLAIAKGELESALALLRKRGVAGTEEAVHLVEDALELVTLALTEAEDAEVVR